MRKIYTLALLTAVLYLEGISQNVGIGTASPAYKLDVAGDVNLTGKLRLNGAATANKVLKTDASGNPVWGDDNNTTYTAGSGITLTGTTFSHTAHTGDATGATSLTVVGLQTRPVANTAPTSGQVLKWNGTSWAPGTDNNNTYTAGSGISVSGTTITNTLPSLWTNSGTNLYPNSTGWNVGIGNTTPGQKLHLSGNFKMDGVAVEGNSNYRVYRNLGAYNSSSSSATGAFVIVTAQPWNSTCMFRAEIEGYFYDATAPFEITVGGYIYNNNAFYNYGYVNTGSKTLTVRFGRNIATNTVAIILGDEAGSYSYPKLNVTSYMQGHGGINESYATGWTITQQTTLSGVVDYIVTVPDVTKLNGLGSGDFIRNQFAGTQTADYWISGTGRATNFDLTNANTRLSQGSGNSLRISTNSGYTEIGPQNTSWSHFQTDRPRFYFNKGITVDEGLIGSYDENLQLQTSGTTRITALSSNGYVGINNTSPAEFLDVSGNIKASGIVYWGNGLVRTETRNDAGLQGNAGARSGFFETSAPSPASSWPTGASSWWHLIDSRHSNNANNYALQIAGSFFDQDLYYRKTNGSPSTAWTKILTTSGSINQGVTTASSTSEVALVSNNTGSLSYGGGAGWAPGTWQSTGFSATRTITSGNMVNIQFTARVEGDNYNYYTPSTAFFRIMRNGVEIARSSTPVAYLPYPEWYYTNNNISLNIMDTGVSGSVTYSVEFWLPNEFSASEVVFLGERYLNIVELRQ